MERNVLAIHHETKVTFFNIFFFLAKVEFGFEVSTWFGQEVVGVHPGTDQVVVLTNKVLPATGPSQNWVLVGTRGLAFKCSSFQVLHCPVLGHLLV